MFAQARLRNEQIASAEARRGGHQYRKARGARSASRIPRNAVRGQWRAHGRYLSRESAAGDQAAAGFDRAEEGIEIGARLESWQAERDQRLWKIIISPEFGDRIDLTRLTRDMMARVERDLGTPLEWVAVAHHNTEHPHVHVALRGVGQDRQHYPSESRLSETRDSLDRRRPLHPPNRTPDRNGRSRS